MQACQVCGTAEVDAGGYCTGCRHYRGPQSYALNPPAADLSLAGPAAGYAAVHADPGGVYHPTPSYQHHAAVAAYPVSPGGQPSAQFPSTPPDPLPSSQPRVPLATSLFMVTVMVVVLVAGTVAVVLIRSKAGGSQPGSTAANNSPAPAVAAAAPSGPPASTAPSASTVDRCVVGEWAVTSWSVQTTDVSLTTDAGGIVRLGADGTGRWDFGSGVTFKGTVEDIKSEDLVTGRVDFAFRTTGQSFTFQNVRSDVREVLNQSGEKPVNRQISMDLGVAEYTCAGDTFRLKIGGYDIQAGRK
jgi:hypothetical protein